MMALNVSGSLAKISSTKQLQEGTVADWTDRVRLTERDRGLQPAGNHRSPLLLSESSLNHKIHYPLRHIICAGHALDILDLVHLAVFRRNGQQRHRGLTPPAHKADIGLHRMYVQHCVGPKVDLTA